MSKKKKKIKHVQRAKGNSWRGGPGPNHLFYFYEHLFLKLTSMASFMSGSQQLTDRGERTILAWCMDGSALYVRVI